MILRLDVIYVVMSHEVYDVTIQSGIVVQQACGCFFTILSSLCHRSECFLDDSIIFDLLEFLHLQFPQPAILFILKKPMMIWLVYCMLQKH